MKKFKLIKYYPGSPEVGEVKSIIWFHSEFYPADHPEFWEEVIEKDYEVLSFKSHYGNRLIEKHSNGLFGIHHGEFTEEDQISKMKSSQPNKKIHSVKRLSDGEIFTVGDKVSYSNDSEFDFVISEIKHNKMDRMSLFGKECGFTVLNNTNNQVFKIKKPLFTTEDGVDIFEGDEFFYVTKEFNLGHFSAGPNSGRNTNYKYFSTREKAEEYIEYNKLKYSEADIVRLLNNI